MQRVPPPALAAAAALAQKALAPRPRGATAVRGAVAAVVATASGVLAGSAAGHFRRTGTTVDPLHPDRASTLVTDGANAVTRNPMYVGLSGLLVANALRRGAWSGLLPVAAFVVAIDRLQVPAEEAALTSRFGADYEAYRAAVPRWLGLRRR